MQISKTENSSVTLSGTSGLSQDIRHNDTFKHCAAARKEVTENLEQCRPNQFKDLRPHVCIEQHANILP